MNNLLLSPIAIFLLLIVVRYLIIFQRILKLALQYPKYRLSSAEKVPAYLKELFQKPVQELEQLEFNFCGYLQVKDMFNFDVSDDWQALLYHPSGKTYAKVKIRRPGEPVHLFDIEFFSFFKDKSLLCTINGQVHAIIGEIPATTINDPYTARLETQWQSHQDKLKHLTGTKIPCLPSPEKFVQALQAHYHLYINSLAKSGQIIPIQNTQLYKMSLLAALKLAFKIGNGSKKSATILKQRRELAKIDPTINTEIPVEVEVEAFQRMQIIEQGRVQRKMGNWVLLGSLALFVLSFKSMFDWQLLLILTGVVFFHEIGHFLMMRLYGYQDTSIFFVPFFGAAAKGRKDNATLTEKFFVLLAGPLPGLLLGVGMAVAFSGSTQPVWLKETSLMLVVINLFNLLPIYPFDGGKIAHILFFSRYPYTDVLFKLLAAMALGLLSYGSPILLGLAILIGFSIPAGFRSAKLDGILRKEIKDLGVSNTDSLLHSIFSIIKKSGYGTLPFAQRYNLVKDLVQRHRDSYAKWTTKFGLSVIYCVCLIGGLVGSIQALTSGYQLGKKEMTTYVRDRQESYHKEIESASQALRVNPKNPKAYLNRATARSHLGDYQGAIQDYNQALRLNPNDTKVYLKRGYIHHQLKNYQAMMEDANQVLKLEPNSIAAYYLRSIARSKLGDERGAIEDRKKAGTLAQNQ